jgi:hypothetical protein
MSGHTEPDDPVIATVRRAVRDALHCDVAALEEMPRGLGLRRFFRVTLRTGEPRSLVARVEAPEDPARRPTGAKPEPPLEPLRSFLEAHGIPVPAAYGGDAAGGVALLEDLGTQSLGAAVARVDAAERRRLYTEACDLTLLYQRAVDPTGRVHAFDRRLDATLFAYKADFFASHGLPAGLGREATPAERAAVTDAFGEIAAEAARAPQRLAHRDFQSANLLVREGRPPGRRLGVIDLQGALLAPPEYDLVCLLRDSYVELPDAEVAYQIGRVRPLLPDAPDSDSFLRRFDLLTLTRKGKDHGLFYYTARVRGLPESLRFVPATVRALRAAAVRVGTSSPRLRRLAELIETLPEPA